MQISKTKVMSVAFCAALSLLSGCVFKSCAVQKSSGARKEEEPSASSSGLSYTVLQSASADAQQPQVGDTVVVHYTGWLADDKGAPIEDKKFDSSVDRGTPFKFTLGVGRVIKGWDEGVMAMKVGEKRRLIIPATLGYGSRGAGAKIPPNATLVFDVELLGIE